MAESDWTFMTNGLSASNVDRGVTNGIARPNGGGSFVYGFNSLTNTPGAVALYANQVNFAPMAKGGSIRGAIKRGSSGGPTSFSPFLFIGAQGVDVNDEAYLLGLSDDDPHRIVLVKGPISTGVPDDAPGDGGVLLRSTQTYSNDTWLHLRLDMIVNANGDVILQCFASDLDANAVTAPVWTAIPGATEFIDDGLNINSGSAPFTSGRAGMGFTTGDTTRRAFFDHIELHRQL